MARNAFTPLDPRAFEQFDPRPGAPEAATDSELARRLSVLERNMVALAGRVAALEARATAAGY